MKNGIDIIDRLIATFEKANLGESVCHPSTGDGVIVIMKERMTALEALKAAKYLGELMYEVFESVDTACEKCDHCVEDCDFMNKNLGFIDVPTHLREHCGIPEGTKIRATLDEDNKRIILTEDGPTPDLRDAPKDIVAYAKGMGICLADLNELIKSEIPVYDWRDNPAEREEDSKNE